ncbi:MAG: hypothetical protein ACRYFU_15495 [Janthinobacterium lividum]
MEKSSHCTGSPVRSRLESFGSHDPLWLLLLTLGTLLVHGYHPWAEDGGLYVADIEHTLDPSLFPHETAFITEHLPYSVFTPAIASLVRLSHLSLAAVLFCIYLLSTALMLYAALRLARQCFPSRAAQWGAVALLSAWWTLPIAGTSLFLMDPYVTARSLSTPFSLLAVSAAVAPWPVSFRRSQPGSWWPTLRSPAVLCMLSIGAAAAFHPLMATYALGLILAIRLQMRKRPWWALAAAGAVILLLAGIVQCIAAPELPPVVAAAHTRYYWFLAQWQWFEWLGLVAPLAIFASLLRWGKASLSTGARAACQASIALGIMAATVAILFAQEHYEAHAVARLQPLRTYLLLYASMILLLGGTVVELTEKRASRVLASRLIDHRYKLPWQLAPWLFIATMAVIMFCVQRSTFPGSIHLEMPGRRNPNPWVQAFLWARDHTAKDTLFALDARYVNTNGEDAQTFRSLSERDAIPDFSKDGGEAANIPRLAPEWWQAAQATRNLSQLSDPERDHVLHPFAVHWVILHANAITAHACPYRNAVVKVCTLP